MLTAINIQTPNREKTFLKSKISMIFCHQIALLILKLSNYLENIPNIIPDKKIKVVFMILLFIFISLLGVLISFKIVFIFSSFTSKYKISITLSIINFSSLLNIILSISFLFLYQRKI